MKEKALSGDLQLTGLGIPALLFLSILFIIFSIASFLYFISVILLYPLYFTVMHLAYTSRTEEDEIHYAKTDDGWEIALHRYIPKTPPGGYPVVFLHGIFVNRFSVDLEENRSLARYLQECGYEVYVPDLRNKGNSRYKGRGRPKVFSFDDLVKKDAPAIIEKVLEVSGKKKLHWIGHSMGGMIGYSLFSLPRISGKIHSLITIAAPGKSDFIRNGPWFAFVRFRKLVNYFNIKFLARIFIPLSGILDMPPESFIYSRENISPNTIRKLKMNAVENTSPLLLQQLAEWIISGKEMSLDGKTNYGQIYKKIKCPVLILGGMKDQIANPAGVIHAYKNCSSKQKKLILFGKEISGKSDFCHMGIIAGNQSRSEVFPEIEKWLKQKSKGGTRK